MSQSAHTKGSVSMLVEINTLKTLADGTCRIAFDMQDGQVLQFAELAAYKQSGGYGNLSFTLLATDKPAQEDEFEEW